MAPESSTVIKNIVEKYLDPKCFKVIEGGPEVAAKIASYPWDLLCFTGSTQKGKLVAEAAAKNLVPCILELGGKCPAVIDASANIDFAASKVSFARFNNSGQTCISTDYVLVHESVQTLFLERLQHHLKVMYGGFGDKGSPDMGKIVTDWHCDRLEGLIKTSKGKILCGGKVNRNIKYMEPTIILNPDLNSPVMQEEIFGPVLPVITFVNFDEVINLINSKDKALAVYYFGSVFGINPHKERLLNETSSGAFLVNEAIIHIVNHEFGFGGVGPSGYGRYGGYDGFKQWSNPKSIMIKPAMNFPPYNSLSPPFTPAKQQRLKMMFGLTGSQNKVVFYLKMISVFLTFYLIFRCYSCCLTSFARKGCDMIFKNE